MGIVGMFFVLSGLLGTTRWYMVVELWLETVSVTMVERLGRFVSVG
jgi:hypothetical protein